MSDMIKDNLIPLNLTKELKNSFIDYAMAVIVSRALPDVRDGLKPVHRRILYAMHELGMTPDKPYRKSARIVGDVLGKYHPHGDSSVYDAMVRLAQDFSTRYLLVDGQGNFGSVDGDDAAAMRYTEARLSKTATDLIADIDKETVDFYPNFDETLMQPAVLPSRFPNLLVNGSGGIAVGMATNIPPHNMGEVIDGVVHMIDNPDCSCEDLMEYIKGPDFPTGATIMGMSGIRAAYMTGRGRVVIRAKSEIEEMNGGRQRIVVTEIPYQVNKARLVEKIAELVHDKRVEGISDLRDESDREGMRLVIELKRDATAQIVLNTLYKHTQLQDTFGVIMIALVDGEPKLLNLRQVIFHYLEHQKDVIIRRCRYELNKAEARAHIVEGLLKALDIIDEVVHTIRASKTTPIAREQLVERFGFTEIQAQAILDMRLARLTGLERDRLQEEFDQLMKTIDYLRAVLQSEAMVLEIIRREILEVRAKYADERRTEIAMVAGEIDIADLIDEEEMVVTLTHFGYVKRQTPDNYRSQRRGGKGIAALTTRDEDFVEKIFVCSTHTDVMFFTNQGRVFRLPCYQLPEAGRQAKGSAIVNLLQLAGGEKVTAVIPVERELQGQDGHYLVMATKDGLIKKTALSEFENIRVSGLIAIVLRDDDELIKVSLTGGDDELLLGTRHGMCIRFSENDIRAMGRATQGVRSIALDGDDEVVAMDIISPEKKVLTITQNGYGKRTDIEEYRLQGRHGKGIKAMNLTDKTGLLAGQLLVSDEEDVMLISDDGTVIRTPVSSISELGRATQGVRLMRMGEDAHVAAISPVAAEDDDDEYDGEEVDETVVTEEDSEI